MVNNMANNAEIGYFLFQCGRVVMSRSWAPGECGPCKSVRDWGPFHISSNARERVKEVARCFYQGWEIYHLVVPILSN